MDSLGRRKTIMLGAMINLVGAILQCSAQNLAMVLVGRIFAGWAVGVLSMSVPIYQSECAHPKTRGNLALLRRFRMMLIAEKVSLSAWPSR
jgi:MFS family permease